MSELNHAPDTTTSNSDGVTIGGTVTHRPQPTGQVIGKIDDHTYQVRIDDPEMADRLMMQTEGRHPRPGEVVIATITTNNTP